MRGYVPRSHETPSPCGGRIGARDRRSCRVATTKRIASRDYINKRASDLITKEGQHQHTGGIFTAALRSTYIHVMKEAPQPLRPRTLGSLHKARGRTARWPGEVGSSSDHYVRNSPTSFQHQCGPTRARVDQTRQPLSGPPPCACLRCYYILNLPQPPPTQPLSGPGG